MDKSRADFNASYDAFEFRREYDKYGPCEAAFTIWQASRKQALEEVRTACEKLGDHEQDLGREKEAFGCDICCDAIRSLEGNAKDGACRCEACVPMGNPFEGTAANVRMILCYTCGNKRCPHATDHRNACTGSNEPGQKGSSWENYTLPGNATKETT